MGAESENANDLGQAALDQHDARPFSSADFAANGLVWDQFFDTNTGNDSVTQY